MNAAKKSPRPKNRTETENKLIRAAERIFSQHGYDGASVKLVAQEAGVNVSLINRYFGGKEGLLLTMIERLVVEKQQGELGYPPQQTLREEIFEYLKFRLRVDIANDQLTRILLSKVAVDKSFRKHVLKSLVSGVDANFLERLEGLQEDGEIPADQDLNALFTAISYFSFSANVLGHAIMGRSRADTLKVFDEFARTYAAGVRS